MITVIHNDCQVALKGLPEGSVGSCVTDPPYGLQFMGKKWDDESTIAFRSELWREVLRVLKPGAHLLAFGGTRTYHRLACAVEDAGFEVRDAIMWHYSTGFPKNHRVNQSPMFCQCGEAVRSAGDKVPLQSMAGHSDKMPPWVRDDLPNEDALRSSDIGSNFLAGCLPDHDSNCVQPLLASTDAQASAPSQQYAQEHSRSFGYEDGQEHGSSDNPFPVRYTIPRANRDCPPQTEEGGVASDSFGSHKSPVDKCDTGDRKLSKTESFSFGNYAGGFPQCQMCGKPVADGFGTSLKPATEIIVMARKPLSERTVAANVLRWGTGAINVDGCRIEAEVETGWGGKAAGGNTWTDDNCGLAKDGDARPVSGRWPANLIHDGSEEVMRLFPETGPSNGSNSGNEPSAKSGGVALGPGLQRVPWTPHMDSGSAARFFYTAKADAADRLGSKHPTVKPVDLIAYLCRLVTPPGGTILDPFAGSGTTGMACLREGFNAILIEREAEYVADIHKRLAHVKGEDTPLFA